MGRTPKATKDLGDSKKDLRPPLKDWAKEIFAEGKDWGPLLMERASSLARQAIEKCEGDISASPTIMGTILTMLTNRYLRADMIYTRGHYSHLQKQAKAIEAALKKLKSALEAQDGMALSWFRTLYNVTSPQNHLEHHDEFLPDWDRLVRGLLHLKDVLESQDIELTKRKNAAERPSAEDRIAHEIAGCYRKAFNKEPGISRHPDHGVSKGPGGPFVRFAMLLENETNPYEDGDISPETVASALKRKK